MRTFVEKLAKAIKERGIYDGYYTNVGIFRVATVARFSGTSLDLSNGENRSLIKLYEDEYDLLNRVITDCRQRTEDVLIEQLNNL